MKDFQNIQPPRWARRLVTWYCRPEILEDLEGDLHEYFMRNCRDGSLRRAKLIYIIDVLKFFRPYTIRKPEILNALIHWIMLSSYIKTSGRNMVRNKLFSFINIFGLSVSMTVGLLMIAMLVDLFSFDKFHENHERIYRLRSIYHYLDNKNADPYATSPHCAAATIKESFPGVEDVAVLKRDFSGDVTVHEKTINLSGFFANESLFNVFSFRLLEGNPSTALKEPFSIVLTEKSAIKIFGESGVTGKVVQHQGKDYTVTGIVEDTPAFSHIRFDMLASLSTREILFDAEKENRWNNMWDTWTYVLLKEDANLPLFQQNLDRYTAEQDKTIEHTTIRLSLYPITSIVTGENQSNQIGPVTGATVIKIFGILSFIVLLSACFNYTNLSIARTFRRSREVGIRKTIGALKSHVTAQFTVESIMIACCALVIAIVLFLLLRQHFISIEESLSQTLRLELTPTLVLIFVAFAITVGISAGIFPALFFSRLNAIQVLKNAASTPRFRGFTVRKGLIVFQYAISIIVITATVIIFKQYKHFVSFDLGFSTENILNIRLQGNKAELVKKEIAELPEVKGISQSGLVQSIGNHWGTFVKNPEFPLDSAIAFHNLIDEHYLPLHDYTFVAGRNFNAQPPDAEESEVIINEHVLKRFNIAGQDPDKAIGATIKVANKMLTIVGVISNFTYSKADNTGTAQEVIMRYSPANAQVLNVKILSSDWPETYSRIEALWKRLDGVHPLDARFYTEEIEQSYNGVKAAIKVGGFLAFLVICIASIGLLGMVVFTAETRLREISIRKVMGANESGLLYLLSKGFLLLLGLAALIGIPATYVGFTTLLLPNLGNAAPLSLFDMFSGSLVVAGIALVMILSHTLKVSRANPAEVLKSE